MVALPKAPRKRTWHFNGVPVDDNGRPIPPPGPFIRIPSTKEHIYPGFNRTPKNEEEMKIARENNYFEIY